MKAVFDTKRLKAVHDYVHLQIDNRQFSGIAWSVEQQGNVVDQGCAGYADAEQPAALGTDAIYRLYSMTKSVVSVVCLQLIESGRLRLQDPVSRWIPAMGSQKVLGSDGRLVDLERPVTVEDLLTHRSGLSYDFLPGCSVADQYREAQLAENGARSLDELVELLASFPLVYQPGTRWYYSYSTDVLARVIECVCDESIGSCLHKLVFAPLGMNDTAFHVAAEKRHRLATMYGQRELGEVPDRAGSSNTLRAMNVDASYPVDDKTFGRGGIGLYSTVDDFRAFMPVLLHGRSMAGVTLLSSPMLDMLWQNRLSAEQMPIEIGGNVFGGYGWGLIGRVMVDTGQAQLLSVPGEGGWAGAASTHFWVDRQHEICGVVMTQYLGSNVPLGADMQSLIYGALQISR